MATVKRFTLASSTGTAPVLVVRQGSTGHVRDDHDGTWKDAHDATTPYIVMTEDADLAGFFTAAITGEVWADDTYTAMFYASSAISGSPMQMRAKRISGDYAIDPGGGVSLVEYALCTLGQVKVELNVPSGNMDEDDRISRAINAATDLIETVTNRRLMKRATNVEEFHKGGDTDESDEAPVLWPREYPIESMADVVSLETGNYIQRIALDLDTLILDRNRVLISPVTVLCEGPAANRLVYRPGYSTAPSDIQGVAINLTQRLYWASKRVEAGDSEETAAGTTRRKAAEAFSPEDKLVIDAYTRVAAGDWRVGRLAKDREWVR